LIFKRVMHKSSHTCWSSKTKEVHEQTMGQLW